MRVILLFAVSWNKVLQCFQAFWHVKNVGSNVCFPALWLEKVFKTHIILSCQERGQTEWPGIIQNKYNHATEYMIVVVFEMIFVISSYSSYFFCHILVLFSKSNFRITHTGFQAVGWFGNCGFRRRRRVNVGILLSQLLWWIDWKSTKPLLQNPPLYFSDILHCFVSVVVLI